MKLVYLNPYGGNFGDALGVEIVERIVGHKVEVVDLWRKSKRLENGIVALGSIFHKIIDGDIVWGTGINPRWQKKKPYRYLDIRSVRGPLTRKYILDYFEQPCPETYGDPALLVKRLFPEKKRLPVRKYGIIPHYWDIDRVKEMPNVMLPTKPWMEVLDFILGCDFIIASSLHALIVAEAYGIPARWWHSSDLKSSETELTFKYNDYFASTNRSQNDWATTIKQALKKGGKEQIVNFNYDALLKSFPKEVI